MIITYVWHGYFLCVLHGHYSEIHFLILILKMEREEFPLVTDPVIYLLNLKAKIYFMISGERPFLRSLIHAI